MTTKAKVTTREGTLPGLRQEKITITSLADLRAQQAKSCQPCKKAGESNNLSQMHYVRGRFSIGCDRHHNRPVELNVPLAQLKSDISMIANQIVDTTEDWHTSLKARKHTSITAVTQVSTRMAELHRELGACAALAPESLKLAPFPGMCPTCVSSVEISIVNKHLVIGKHECEAVSIETHKAAAAHSLYAGPAVDYRPHLRVHITPEHYSSGKSSQLRSYRGS